MLADGIVVVKVTAAPKDAQWMWTLVYFPKGRSNGNYYRHGRYTAEAIAWQRWLRRLTRDVRALTKRLRQP